MQLRRRSLPDARLHSEENHRRGRGVPQPNAPGRLHVHLGRVTAAERWEMVFIGATNKHTHTSTHSERGFFPDSNQD